MARRTIYLDALNDAAPGSGPAGDSSAILTFFKGVVREAQAWISRGGPGVKAPTIEKHIS
ncbi:hypothetical protein BBK36DRAFT_1109747 [Trichoderma citrinoviride]|uniref:Uncharacterized protein n=1 Tax=Trichoderma citrinoviride TaxID=58853 RepID=A0A2T4BJF3_9HYPO|nr:hypothetical protein BBK36DRAFT_1109747 [Trichoderma citrinoviride]PTB69446.1 hypothetical protein BBK36DRAFT_1109747 [Trichoderma citrinoviride]